MGMGTWLWITCGFLLVVFARTANGVCDIPVGIGTDPRQSLQYIPDQQMTASTKLSTQYEPYYARLNEERGWKAWCPDNNDLDLFLMVDLGVMHTLTSIETRGAPGNGNWVSKFSLRYSYDDQHWYDYKIDGKIKYFKGNKDSLLPVKNDLPSPLTTRYVRVHPVKEDKGITPCMGMELYGCHPSEDCDTPVGMEDGRIKDGQITASSQWGEHRAWNARLNNIVKSVNGTNKWGAWCTENTDLHQYLQVDFGRVRGLSGVKTQGYMWANWVSEYHFNYSIDGQVWQTIRKPDGEKKMFYGNWDEDTVKQNKFDHRVFARYVRFCPVKWKKKGMICMRVEILECLPTKGSVPTVGPPGSTVDVNRMHSVNLTCMTSGQQGVKRSWLKNGVAVGAPSSVSRIYSSNYSNGSELSVLELREVKYKDRDAVISCTAWYPGVAINASRTIHLFVHAPRPNISISNIEASKVKVKVEDPTPQDTDKYLIRFRRVNQFEQTTIERPKMMTVDDDGRRVAVLSVSGLHPYTRYQLEVASNFKDKDIGPYSTPERFTTEEAVPSGPPRDILVVGASPDAIRVSWLAPDQKLCNGRISNYQVKYRETGGNWRRVNTDKKAAVISGLTKDRWYEVVVRAYTKVGPGPWSEREVYYTATERGSKLTSQLEDLDQVTVTDKNAGEIAKGVGNITSESSELVEKDISIAAKILEKVVKTNETSPLVGDHVLNTLNNVMEANKEVLHKTEEKYNSSGKFVEILEEYINKGGKFSKGTPNVAVHSERLKKSFNKRYVTTVTTEKDKIKFNSTDSGDGLDGDASVIIPGSAIPTNSSANVTVIVVYYKSSQLFKPDFRKTEVCEDGFTGEKEVEGRRRTSSYTPVRMKGKVVTESSPVLAASLRNMNLANLSSPVIIKFKMPEHQILENSTQCVWWNFKKRIWSKEGCSLKNIINDTIVCHCNHMTNFAVLVDVHASSSKACGDHAMVLSWISKIGCGLSMIGLAITVFTYGFFKKLRKDAAAKILLNLCVALLAVLLVFISGIERGKLSDIGCMAVAVLIHYFLLVVFTWMLIEAYFMYTAFVKVWHTHGDYVMWKCMLIGWGTPLIVVVATLSVDMNSYGGKHFCRLDDNAFYFAFVAPVVTVLLINTIVFTAIMYKLSTRLASNSADKDRGRDSLVQLRRAFGILILVGLTWIFGFFAVSRARLAFQYLFGIFNAFQGFSIFMFYCVSQKNVRECWSALMRCDLESLRKSKTMYTDSCDRRRLSSASKAQMDALRARSNTANSALAQILQQAPPMRLPDVVVNYPVNKEQYDNRVSYEEDEDGHNVTINLQQSDQSDVDSHCSCAELTVAYSSQSPSVASRNPSMCGSHNPSMCGSRNPSMCGSRNPSMCGSHNPSMCGSRETVNSARSTPKVLRLPHLQRLRSRGALNWSRASLPFKPALKRTASHTPGDHRPPGVHTLLRRTRSSTSHVKEDRYSGNLSICSYNTSSESLSSEAQSPTIRKYVDYNFGIPILNPLHGSIRGIHGQVERNVDNYDELIQQQELERGRSFSQPVSPSHSIK